MISLNLTSQKAFISQLLLKDTFDSFQFIEGEIVTFNTFTIDGYVQQKFFDDDTPQPEYSYWKNIRDFCFSVIKGKRTPLSFKFIFRLSPENTAKLIAQNELDFQPENVQGLYLNIRFDSNGMKCVTGTSLKIFSLDKSLEKVWDTAVQKFFAKKEIAYEIEV